MVRLRDLLPAMPKIAPQRYAEVLRVLENSFLTAAGYEISERPESIDQAFSNSAARKEENERLDKVISEMKQAAGAMPKKAWYRTLLSKISTFIVSEGGKALIESTVKGLLGS